MSFGYSVGDCIAGANLTYRLIRAFTETKGSSKEFQEAMVELSSLQQMFLSISHMEPTPSFDIATINAASHIICSSMELIGDFFERTKAYRKQLSSGHGNSSGLSNSWQKVGWALFKRQELESLRDVLRTKLSHIHLLLSTANYWGQASLSAGQASKYQDKLQTSYESKKMSTPTQNDLAISHGNEKFQSGDQSSFASVSVLETPRADFQDPVKLQSTSQPSNRQFSKEAVLSQRADLASKARRVITVLQEETGIFTDRIARTQVLITELVESVIQAESWTGEKDPRLITRKEKPIKFKDAVGRKFSFPFHLCCTWEGMEDMIRQAFLNVDIIGPHVAEGHYDLIGPNNEIILPGAWDTVIEPDWTITMHMWPMPEPADRENEAIQEVLPLVQLPEEKADSLNDLSMSRRTKRRPKRKGRKAMKAERSGGNWDDDCS